MENTWGQRDLPVLAAIVEIVEESGHDTVRATDIERHTGFDQQTVARALTALKNANPPYFLEAKGLFNGGFFMVSGITGAARQAVGAWPSPDTLADALIDRLQALADDESAEPEVRDRAKQGLRAFLGAGRDVLVGAAGSALSAGVIG